MVIITSMHYESTVIHNAGVSESNFLEKFAHVVADPAIMEVLKSMMLGSVTRLYPGVHIFSCNQDNFLAVGLGCWTK